VVLISAPSRNQSQQIIRPLDENYQTWCRTRLPTASVVGGRRVPRPPYPKPALPFIADDTRTVLIVERARETHPFVQHKLVPLLLVLPSKPAKPLLAQMVFGEVDHK
ncbi:unnamed protein product, partial [Ectocarpus sp. 4 AP-2014]